MSWSVSGIVTTQSAASVLAELKVSALSQNPDGGDQFDAAAEAVRSILNSGSVGAENKEFSLSMTGHGNPGHEHRAGWANDFVNISIGQI